MASDTAITAYNNSSRPPITQKAPSVYKVRVEQTTLMQFSGPSTASLSVQPVQSVFQWLWSSMSAGFAASFIISPYTYDTWPAHANLYDHVSFPCSYLDLKFPWDNEGSGAINALPFSDGALTNPQQPPWNEGAMYVAIIDNELDYNRIKTYYYAFVTSQAYADYVAYRDAMRGTPAVVRLNRAGRAHVKIPHTLNMLTTGPTNSGLATTYTPGLPIGPQKLSTTAIAGLASSSIYTVLYPYVFVAIDPLFDGVLWGNPSTSHMEIGVCVSTDCIFEGANNAAAATTAL